MLRFLFFSTFTIFFFIGCNSERAQMRRIANTLPPMMLQFGKSFWFNQHTNLIENERCHGLAYDEKTETTICVGVTRSDFVEPRGGVRDGFIIKFDRKFRILWIKQFGLYSGFPKGDLDVFHDVALDENGFIYVGGSFQDSSQILKLSPDGKILWRHPTPGECDRLVLKDAVYCSGRIRTSDVPLLYDTFVTKVSLAGELDWEKTLSPIERPGIDVSKSEECHDLSISDQGRVACIGATTGELTISNSTGSYDGFVWILDQFNGTTIDLRQFGSHLHNEWFQAGGFDNLGNLYISGQFNGSNIDDSLTDTDFDRSKKHSPTRHVFFTRLNFENNIYSFDPKINSTSIIGQSDVTRLIFTRDGHAVVCVETYGSLFETSGEVGADPATYDIAVVKYDLQNFSIVAQRQFGEETTGKFKNNHGNQQCKSITQDVYGNILMAGSTRGSTQDENAGGDDIMIWRVGPNLEF